jgi:hypothetical protein
MARSILSGLVSRISGRTSAVIYGGSQPDVVENIPLISKFGGLPPGHALTDWRGHIKGDRQ